MTVLPDRALVRYAVILALASAGLFVSPWWWVVIGAGLACLVAAALGDLIRLRQARGIAASLRVPSAVQRGDALSLEFTVENPVHRPWHVTVRPLLPEACTLPAWEGSMVLPAAGRVTRSVTLDAPVRGAYAFEGIWLRIATPARMLQLQRGIETGETCRVLPDVRRVKDALLSRRVQNFGAPLLHKSARRGLGSSFESLRDYEQGDDIRRIDWRATAKHRHLITRNYEIEPDRTVMIMLDCGRLMGARAGGGTKLDHAVDAALMVAAVALDSGDRCGLLCFDAEVRTFIPPRASLAHLDQLTRALTDTRPTLEESHFSRAFTRLQSALRKRSLVLVITDFIDPETSQGMMRALRILGDRNTVVVAALRTPAVGEVIAAPAGEGLGPYRKAVAHRLRHDRQRVIASLRKGGVTVIDTGPDALTVPLVNQYISLRERDRL